MIGIEAVVIHEKDDKVHDRFLHKQMEMACEHDIVFKCAVKQLSVTFFGCVYIKDWAHLDTPKVIEVHNMPFPETPTHLQKFLIIVTYLSPFVPALSSFTASLYGLLKRAHSSHGMNHTRNLLTL